ncbi:MAG TPA: hypothetical protein VHJ19_03120 [Gammaproteobacteria bacterium]|nr:hypothetical protein [Gammaproteobacteria bacterium]
MHYIDDGPHVGDRSAAKDQKRAANINMHALTFCAGKLNSVVLVCKAIQYLTVTLPYIISIIFLGRSPRLRGSIISACCFSTVSRFSSLMWSMMVTIASSRRIVTDATGRALPKPIEGGVGGIFERQGSITDHA